MSELRQFFPKAIKKLGLILADDGLKNHLIELDGGKLCVFKGVELAALVDVTNTEERVRWITYCAHKVVRDGGSVDDLVFLAGCSIATARRAIARASGEGRDQMGRSRSNDGRGGGRPRNEKYTAIAAEIVADADGATSAELVATMIARSGCCRNTAKSAIKRAMAEVQR